MPLKVLAKRVKSPRKGPMFKDPLMEAVARYSPKEVSVALENLKIYPRNANKHGRRSIEACKASLKKWGQLERLVVQRSTMFVLGGNGRLEAMKEIPWREPVKIILLDIEEPEAALLSAALNRIPEFSERDDKILTTVLQEAQKSLGLEAMEAGGYSQGEVTALLESIKAEQTILTGGDSKFDSTFFEEEQLKQLAKEQAERQSAKPDEDSEDEDSDDSDDEDDDPLPEDGDEEDDEGEGGNLGMTEDVQPLAASVNIYHVGDHCPHCNKKLPPKKLAGADKPLPPEKAKANGKAPKSNGKAKAKAKGGKK